MMKKPKKETLETYGYTGQDLLNAIYNYHKPGKHKPDLVYWWKDKPH